MTDDLSGTKGKANHAPLHMDERFRILAQMIKEQGVVKVVKRKNLDHEYRFLLELLTRFEGTIKDSKEVREIIKPYFASVKKKIKYKLVETSSKEQKSSDWKEYK